MKGLVHELLEDLFVDPGAADADLNLTGVQIFRLRLFQRCHIDLKGGILLCCPLGLAEFLSHIAGEIFVGGLPALVPMAPAFLQVKGAGRRVFEDDAVQLLHDLRDLLRAAHERGHEAEIHTGFFTEGNSERFHGGVYM